MSKVRQFVYLGLGFVGLLLQARVDPSLNHLPDRKPPKKMRAKWYAPATSNANHIRKKKRVRRLQRKRRKVRARRCLDLTI